MRVTGFGLFVAVFAYSALAGRKALEASLDSYVYETYGQLRELNDNDLNDVGKEIISSYWHTKSQ